MNPLCFFGWHKWGLEEKERTKLTPHQLLSKEVY